MSKNSFVFSIYRDRNLDRLQTIEIASSLKHVYILFWQAQTIIIYIKLDLNQKKYNNFIRNSDRMSSTNQLRYKLRNLKIKEFYVRYRQKYVVERNKR